MTKSSIKSLSPERRERILLQASEILAERYCRQAVLTSPYLVKEYLRCKLGGHDREIFGVLLLDNANQLIRFEELFRGTINSASIYPRDVVKAVLDAGAAAVIFAHNHPSGNSEPSEADKRMTSKLTAALQLIDVRVLDHIVVGETCYSFAEQGLI